MTPKAFNKAMGRAVDQLRKANGYSLADLGQKLGVSYQQAGKYMHGENGFSAHYLPKVAAVFGVTVADLYERVGIQMKAVEPSPADNDAFLAARYVAKIPSGTLRRNIIDFARKCAYEGDAA